MNNLQHQLDQLNLDLFQIKEQLPATKGELSECFERIVNFINKVPPTAIVDWCENNFEEIKARLEVLEGE